MIVQGQGHRHMYFRLRGTNLAPSTPNQTDAQGNPLSDTLSYAPIPNPADGGATMTAAVNSPDLGVGRPLVLQQPDLPQRRSGA